MLPRCLVAHRWTRCLCVVRMIDLFEERAILFSRMNDHKRALQIYAHNLKDFEGALKYCEANYNEGANKDIYLLLLEVYLTPAGTLSGTMLSG